MHLKLLVDIVIVLGLSAGTVLICRLTKAKSRISCHGRPAIWTIWTPGGECKKWVGVRSCRIHVELRG